MNVIPCTGTTRKAQLRRMSAEHFELERQIRLTKTNYQKQIVTRYKVSVDYSSSTFLCVTPYQQFKEPCGSAKSHNSWLCAVNYTT